ncbi:hypothetical protein Ancab_037629 [Ancistrocladus abbreviatus]
MDTSKHQTVRNLVFLALLIAGLLFLSFTTPKVSKSFISFQTFDCPTSANRKITPVAAETKKDELEEALGRSSMANRTVIIAVVDRAYAEEEIPNMLDLFLESFWVGEGTRELVDHLLIVAVDQTAYDRCLYRGLHCYRLETEGVDFTGGGREKVFMSEDFIKMMWRRTLFLLDVLKRGYSFIFTDTDVMWLRNPFTMLNTNQTQSVDIQFSTDAFLGNPTSKYNPINTGFYHVRSNNRTIALFEKWYGLKDNSTGLKEQDVLQNLTRKGVLRELNMTARFLETRHFSGFCQDSKDFGSVITVHANCCRYISAKVADLIRVLNDWKKFKGAGAQANQTTSFRWSPHFACRRSWRLQKNITG